MVGGAAGLLLAVEFSESSEHIAQAALFVSMAAGRLAGKLALAVRGGGGACPSPEGRGGEGVEVVVGSS